ncbi:hypothetical protein EVAR_18166_1 [Eumeta japonica]|uniref:Uncharacterized protein n=1 Tax=Eumeta variegata TaxID=151549 RepID=A0A4C1UWG9_EUMVA|nr:hypothetical protein EVAR_18166_1 [Eumeta japonica]
MGGMRVTPGTALRGTDYNLGGAKAKNNKDEIRAGAGVRADAVRVTERPLSAAQMYRSAALGAHLVFVLFTPRRQIPLTISTAFCASTPIMFQ